MQTLILIKSGRDKVHEARPYIRSDHCLINVALAHQLTVSRQSLELHNIVIIIQELHKLFMIGILKFLLGDRGIGHIADRYVG